MQPHKLTREEMWSRQQLSVRDMDYNVWNKQKLKLQQWADLSGGYVFAVDVCKGCYAFASDSFADLLGYKASWLRNIEREGDILEECIHPEDREEMILRQIEHSHFIYSLPVKERNDYQTIYEYRMRNTKNQDIRMISRQKVLLKDPSGKAWIILGCMDISPNQLLVDGIRFSTLHIPSKQLVYSGVDKQKNYGLTAREIEILQLISRGLLSKEIADKLHISIYTVHNHRKNILAKLGVDNSMEAIRVAVSFL